jgi:hypothetical protein
MRFLSEPPVGERYKLYVQMFNRVVIGLAVMILFWHWLANVWDQQLDGGRAWTTAGRFIPATRRVGYMLGAIALLVSFQVAFWPKMEFVHDLDDTRGRWIWGLAGHLLLVFALGTSARWTGKQTLAWLTLFAAVAAVSFILVRVPSSPVGQWWTLKWPVATPVIAAIALVLSFLAGRSQTSKMFTDPLLVVVILIAPMSGIMGITFGRQLRIEPWIPYATFFGLTAAYTLAVFLTGPKRLVVLAVLCLGMGIWNFV